MSKFRRFAPIEVRFLPFGYFPVDKNREEIRDFRIWEGEKIRIFGQNIYPCRRLFNSMVCEKNQPRLNVLGRNTIHICVK